LLALSIVGIFILKSILGVVESSRLTALRTSGKLTALDLGNNVKLRVALIPAGTFMMGSPMNEDGRLPDENQREVTISKPFYMGTFPVTQAQYQAVMGKNPSLRKEVGLLSQTADQAAGKNVIFSKGADKPVEQVSWSDAVKFCEKLSKKTGQKFRLPTEAEWEYACRAGTTTPFNTGMTITKDQAAYQGSANQPTFYGVYPANGWGHFDMHGNVLEWCSDWYGEYLMNNITDPKGANGGSSRVLRGGSYKNIPQECRSASRHKASPDYGRDNIGFRVVLDL